MLLDYHRRLIEDTPRTAAFRNAIRAVVTPESVVLDLGSGSGILSFFACQAGARRVFAVDDGHMADVIPLLARQLGYAGRIQVFHEHSAKIELPERATVLVTETLGSLALDESILSSVLDARRRLLTPDAAIIPRDATMHIVPVELPRLYEQRIDWWNEEHYGFDLSPIRTLQANYIHPLSTAPETFLADPAAIITVELARITSATAAGTAEFRASRAGTLHGFAGWMTSSLTAEIAVTGYGHTSWSQVFLPLASPIPVAEGTPIALTIETDDARGDDIRGAWFRWRGDASGRTFDQNTTASFPECTR